MKAIAATLNKEGLSLTQVERFITADGGFDIKASKKTKAASLKNLSMTNKDNGIGWISVNQLKALERR